jgi:hypothetical protein
MMMGRPHELSRLKVENVDAEPIDFEPCRSCWARRRTLSRAVRGIAGHPPQFLSLLLRTRRPCYGAALPYTTQSSPARSWALLTDSTAEGRATAKQ